MKERWTETETKAPVPSPMTPEAGYYCPNCEGVIGKHVEIGTGIEHNSSIGDLGICFDCGAMMITTEKGLESLEDKSFLSWFERLQLSIMHGEWSRKSGIHGS